MTPTHALFIGWNRAIPGREAMGMETFQSMLNLLGKWHKDSRIESFEPAIMEAHGGDLNGFCIIRGKSEELHKLVATPEWQDLWTRGVFSIQGLGITTCFVNDGLKDRMTRWQKLIQENQK